MVDNNRTDVPKYKCPKLEDDREAFWNLCFHYEAFQNGKALYEEADRKQKERNSSFLMLPVDYSMEFTAFGGKVKWNGSKFLPDGYLFQDINEIRDILRVYYQRDNFGLIFDYLAQTKGREDVLLAVEGPFSVLCSLIDPIIVFKNIRREGILISEVLNHIAEFLVSYIKDLLDHGVSVVSLADSVGTIDVLGKRNYNIVGQAMYTLMKQLEPELSRGCIHLCGRCSDSMEQTGFLLTTKEAVLGTYGRIILDCAKKEEVKFLGNGCIKCEDCQVEQIWKVELAQ